MSLARLVELAELEQQAVSGHRWEALEEIRAEQRQILEAARGRLTTDDRAALEFALGRSRESERALFASLAETQGIIERMRAGRRRCAYAGSGRAALELRA